MDVDEARRDEPAVGVDLARRPRASTIADGRDPVAVDRHVRAGRLGAGAVDHLAVADDEIVSHVVPPGPEVKVPPVANAGAQLTEEGLDIAPGTQETSERDRHDGHAPGRQVGDRRRGGVDVHPPAVIGLHREVLAHLQRRGIPAGITEGRAHPFDRSR